MGAGEFDTITRAIVEAADRRAGLLAGVEVDGLVAEWSPAIAAARDASVAAALNAQAEFYWEASTLLDPTRAIAEANGEESMTAVLDAQIRTMREVSSRLRRRAASFQGLSAEDQAIHAMAAGNAGPTLLVNDASLSLHATAQALSAEYFAAHPELDPRTTSLEFRSMGADGWRVIGHKVLDEPPGYAMTPAPAGVDPAEAEPTAPPPCCDCCSVGDGQCYCEGPKAKMCKCAPCKKAREDMK